VFYDFWVNNEVNEDVYAYSNRAGDGRAIIVYNNRFAPTAGWIRSSTSFAVRTGNNEEMTLTQTTLGESLGFKGDGRHYYIFRDYSSGLEYIRNGRELCEQGLFVEMAEYEYHAFLDFREVCDDEFGTWGALCHQLLGSPVDSMDEEVKLIRFAPLINNLEEMVDRHSGLLTGDFEALDRKSLEKIKDSFFADFDQFLADLAVVADLTGKTGPMLSALKKELAWLECEYAKGEAKHPPAGYTAKLLAFAWLCMHRVGELEQGDDPAAATSDLVERFGLARPLQEELYAEAGGEADPMSMLDVSSVIALFKAILHWQELLTLPLEDQEEWFADLLSDLNVAAFICRHASGPHEWFVKERWETLLEWLELVSLVNEAGAAKSGKVSVARRKAVSKAAEALIRRGTAAGYRIDRFLAPDK
jgi:hypothetical protein